MIVLLSGVYVKNKDVFLLLIPQKHVRKRSPSINIVFPYLLIDKTLNNTVTLLKIIYLFSNEL